MWTPETSIFLYPLPSTPTRRGIYLTSLLFPYDESREDTFSGRGRKVWREVQGSVGASIITTTLFYETILVSFTNKDNYLKSSEGLMLNCEMINYVSAKVSKQRLNLVLDLNRHIYCPM